MRICTECYTENMKERDKQRDINIDENILLKWILKERGVNVWTGLI
jgi:hypothetical protein